MLITVIGFLVQTLGKRFLKNVRKLSSLDLHQYDLSLW